MSASRLGKPLPSEHRVNISKALAGKVVSDEARANMSMAAKRKVFTPEHREKIIAALRSPDRLERNRMLGKQRGISPDVRAKALAANLGSHRSLETRAKMSESAKRVRAERKAKQLGASYATPQLHHHVQLEVDSAR